MSPAFSQKLYVQIQADAEQDELMSYFLSRLAQRLQTPERFLAEDLASRLQCQDLAEADLKQLLLDRLVADPGILQAAQIDLEAIQARDPACPRLWYGLVYFKGFKALLTARIAASYWRRGNKLFALHLQSRAAAVFSVDIHPAATLGRGIVLDHADGVVVGETAAIGDEVLILQGVTLGSSGKQCGGDRHPKVGNHVTLGAGSSILGNIQVGDGAVIGAGSIVLQDIPPYSTAVGAPARIIRQSREVRMDESPLPSTIDIIDTNPPLISGAMPCGIVSRW